VERPSSRTIGARPPHQCRSCQRFPASDLFFAVSPVRCWEVERCPRRISVHLAFACTLSHSAPALASPGIFTFVVCTPRDRCGLCVVLTVRSQAREWVGQRSSAPGRRDTRSAASTARTGAVLARVYDRAGRADDAQGFRSLSGLGLRCRFQFTRASCATTAAMRWATRATTPGRCKPTLATRISSTRCALYRAGA
jgi:hypothetical protein